MRRKVSVFGVYVILFSFTASLILYVIYEQVNYVRKQRQDLLHNFHSIEDEDEELEKGGKLFWNRRMYLRSIYKIRAQIKWYNKKLTLHNTNLGPINSESFVIVIQCHSNIFYLQQLINSLKTVSMINKAVLIFSHDHYSYTINELVKTITFAQYIQIFYPYSMQLHPNVFPGNEPKSCIKGMPCVKSMFRNPEAAQSKHHWWWQANQIFNHMSALKRFNEPILFLEDNNFLIEDALIVFRLLIFAKNVHCPFCEIISLAAHEHDISQYTRKRSLVVVEEWSPNIPRTAIAFSRNTWNAIKTWKEEFCYFNDSTWDNSLRHLGAEKWEGNIYLITMEGPRVFRIEKCDEKDVGCKMQQKVDKVKKFAASISDRMYPWSIKIKASYKEDSNLTESGYWSDVRDHQLCMRFANESVWY